MLVAVVGTGTGVGKTYVTCSIARGLRRSGRRVAALKPIESGLDGAAPSDAEQLAEAAGMFHVKRFAGFEVPVSPHLAARESGMTLELGAIADWVRGERQELTLVESAGGLFSPLTSSETNFEMVAALAPDAVVLVGSDRLGTLHDVLACVRAGVERLAPKLSVVLSAPAVPDRSTGTNAAELRALADLAVATIPRGGEVDLGALRGLDRFT